MADHGGHRHRQHRRARESALRQEAGADGGAVQGHSTQLPRRGASTLNPAVLILGPTSLIVLALVCLRGQRRRKHPTYKTIGDESIAAGGSSVGLTRRPTRGGGVGSEVPSPTDPAQRKGFAEASSREARRMQPIFDIDDTIKSSGNYNIMGYALGGVDSQYSRGAIYPGVAQFALELSSHGLPPGEQPAPVAVLTARAKELGPALKLGPHHSVVKVFQQVGEANGHPNWGIGWDKGCVLYGSVAEWVRVENRGLRKFHNFRETLSTCTHPDVGGVERNQYILVGDTGEWDLHCGELMLENYAQDVMAVFMHCVSADEASTSVPHDANCNGRPICFFKTYPGAALKAFQHNLLSAQAMLRVCDSASSDLRVIEAVCPYSSRWADLERDIELCKVLYANHAADAAHYI